MAGSDASVHGEHHGEEGAPVTRAEFRQLQQAIGRMLDERPPARGHRVPHRQNPIDPHDEASNENSVEAAANGGREDEFSNCDGDD